jgi:hypothetical protein
MHVAPAGEKSGVYSALANRRPFDSPPGFRLLVPGWPQLYWKQNPRAAVFMGSFVTAILVGVWTWGTWVGWGFFVFGFLGHVMSATDALGQSSFPNYSRRAAVLVVSASLCCLLYAPAVLVVSTLAWPGFSGQETGTGYAVNRWAYRSASPRVGDWIWTRLHARGKPHAAQIVATGGQEVEWTGRNWRIDGLPFALKGSLRLTAWPQSCRFHVPSDQVLVEPEELDAATTTVGPLVLVPSQAIVGRAWAQLYPMLDRHLL